jgi:hypothetical protein
MPSRDFFAGAGNLQGILLMSVIRLMEGDR